MSDLIKKYNLDTDKIRTNSIKHDDVFKEHLRTDTEYAQMWFDEMLKEYSETKDIVELVCYLKPLIEANYTICDFAKLTGIHRVTLCKIFANKMTPSIDTLHKIFKGLGYNLKLSAEKA